MAQLPPGVRFIVLFTRDQWCRAFIFVLTFLLYASFHLSRKPISIVKGELHKHCAPPSEVELNSYKEYAIQIQPVKKLSNESQCGWEPFDKNNYKQLLGALDYSFLCAYAVGMYLSGIIGERLPIRYYLTAGMLASGLFTAMFGLGYFYNIHNLWFYMIAQRTYKSEASKQKAAKDAEKELEKIPKLSTYFALQSNVQVQAHETDSTSSDESYPEVRQAFLKERDFWRNVVKRMVDVVIFLSERNLAFRGSNEKLGDPSNGNFLGLFELLAKYDAVLSELLQRIKKAETHVQYLSPQIQNELIQLVASNIQEANIGQLKKAKYYSVILDCTPDVSHEEQMSVVLRFVEFNGEDGVNIREAFVGFLNVHDTTGEGLLEAFLEKANNLGIDIADMRGQAYDNGSSKSYMNGTNKFRVHKPTLNLKETNNLRDPAMQCLLPERENFTVPLNHNVAVNGEGGTRMSAISFIGALRIPGVIEFSLCLLFAKLVSYTFLFWLPLYITNVEHLDAKRAGDLSTLFDVGGIFGGILAGMISDRLEKRASTCGMMLLLAAPALYMFSAISKMGLEATIVMLLISGALVNGPYALITTAVSADLGTHKSLKGNARALSTVTAIIDGTGSVGAALGPLLAGLISPSGWNNVFYMLMVADACALLFLLRLIRKELQCKMDQTLYMQEATFFSNSGNVDDDFPTLSDDYGFGYTRRQASCCIQMNEFDDVK
ncbi:glucose-6-phosphate exchanger SLC37A1-like [Terrapene carolina triunguis]|uniref:glucose-6-phosphate exchanger SLC37A1-like n=1 Tax=Terrapene triunguis TaxID=2587831 RepID=UPI0011561485|nr:glucose-6-phosphate exchanger SLC37A1-like [Terrapene carolina triunguis]